MVVAGFTASVTPSVAVQEKLSGVVLRLADAPPAQSARGVYRSRPRSPTGTTWFTATASPASRTPLALASSQSVPLPGSVTIRIAASPLPVPVVPLEESWLSPSVKPKLAAMKLSVASSLTVSVVPVTVGTSLVLSRRSVKSVETVAVGWPEPSLAVSRITRSVAFAGGLPVKVPVVGLTASHGGSADPSISVAE